MRAVPKEENCEFSAGPDQMRAVPKEETWCGV